MKIGSLCTGLGQLDRAVMEVLDAEVAWVAEIDPDAGAVLARSGIPNIGSIDREDWSDVERVDIITAGFPCQPASVAGRRGGTGDARWLWPSVAGAVRHLRPRLVFVENVPGLLTVNAGDAFNEVLSDLADLGYDAQWTCLSAGEVGACHLRNRLFLVAHPSGSPLGPQPLSEPRSEHQVVARQVGQVAAHADGAGRGRLPEQDGEPFQTRDGVEYVDLHGLWGDYAGAVGRHERVFGMTAPTPFEIGPRGGRRLNPAFPAWMMGVPFEMLDGLSRRAQLRLVGNSVVARQAAAALRLLLRWSAEPV